MASEYVKMADGLLPLIAMATPADLKAARAKHLQAIMNVANAKMEMKPSLMSTISARNGYAKTAHGSLMTPSQAVKTHATLQRMARQSAAAA